jgi:hypothetical protein
MKKGEKHWTEIDIPVGTSLSRRAIEAARTFVEENNSCYVPLGGEKCGCGNGDGTTLFIRRLDISWTKASLTYTFKNDEIPPVEITKAEDVSMCLGQILNVFIPMAEGAKEDDEIMEFWIDGNNVGLTGAKELLEKRKEHSRMFHAKK